MTAWRAETGFVGVACGIMDQFASALSSERHALHLNCETTETDDAPFADAVLIVDSAVRRSLRHSEFNQRRAECEQALFALQGRYPGLRSLAAVLAPVVDVGTEDNSDPLGKRAMHVSRETRRVREAVAMLRAGRPLSGELLLDSHASLRDLYECSRPELDWLVDRAVAEPGVRGARLTRSMPLRRASSASTSQSSALPPDSGCRRRPAARRSKRGCSGHPAGHPGTVPG